MLPTPHLKGEEPVGSQLEAVSGSLEPRSYWASGDFQVHLAPGKGASSHPAFSSLWRAGHEARWLRGWHVHMLGNTHTTSRDCGDRQGPAQPPGLLLASLRLSPCQAHVYLEGREGPPSPVPCRVPADRHVAGWALLRAGSVLPLPR